MSPIAIAILTVEGIGFTVIGMLLVYFIYRRIQDKKNEHFEDRDN